MNISQLAVSKQSGWQLSRFWAWMHLSTAIHSSCLYSSFYFPMQYICIPTWQPHMPRHSMQVPCSCKFHFTWHTAPPHHSVINYPIVVCHNLSGIIFFLLIGYHGSQYWLGNLSYHTRLLSPLDSLIYSCALQTHKVRLTFHLSSVLFCFRLTIRLFQLPVTSLSATNIFKLLKDRGTKGPTTTRYVLFLHILGHFWADILRFVL